MCLFSLAFAKPQEKKMPRICKEFKSANSVLVPKFSTRFNFIEINWNARLVVYDTFDTLDARCNQAWEYVWNIETIVLSIVIRLLKRREELLPFTEQQEPKVASGFENLLPFSGWKIKEFIGENEDPANRFKLYVEYNEPDDFHAAYDMAAQMYNHLSAVFSLVQQWRSEFTSWQLETSSVDRRLFPTPCKYWTFRRYKDILDSPVDKPSQLKKIEKARRYVDAYLREHPRFIPLVPN